MSGGSGTRLRPLLTPAQSPRGSTASSSLPMVTPPQAPGRRVERRGAGLPAGEGAPPRMLDLLNRPFEQHDGLDRREGRFSVSQPWTLVRFGSQVLEAGWWVLEC